MSHQTPRLNWNLVLLTLVFLGSPTAALGAIEDCGNPIEVEIRPHSGVTMKFCEIPAARGVLIGSRNGRKNEKPVKERRFKRNFHMGQFEVTQLQYKTISRQQTWRKSDGSTKKYVKTGDDHPVNYVTYYQARAFVKKLTQLIGDAAYRLPTEAEWEYAARGPNPNQNRTEYPWGNRFDSTLAHYFGYNDSRRHPHLVTSCPGRADDFIPECPKGVFCDDGAEEFSEAISEAIRQVKGWKKRAVGHCANGFGLMHMIGNVWEYVHDTYENDYRKAPRNGHIPFENNDPIDAVIRGGSWGNEDESRLRSAYRLPMSRKKNHSNVGFRVVRMVEED